MFQLGNIYSGTSPNTNNCTQNVFMLFFFLSVVVFIFPSWCVGGQRRTIPLSHLAKNINMHICQSCISMRSGTSMAQYSLELCKLDHIALWVTSLTADTGVPSLIPAWSHTFVAIDHEIISTVILLLPLIQKGLLSFTSQSTCTVQEVLVSHLVKKCG